jgi:hypothetical protein
VDSRALIHPIAGVKQELDRCGARLALLARWAAAPRMRGPSTVMRLGSNSLVDGTHFADLPPLDSGCYIVETIDESNNAINKTEGGSRRLGDHVLQIDDIKAPATSGTSCVFADGLLIPLSDINLGFHPPMPDILTRCPKTGRTIKTGLTTEMIEIDSLPRVPIPVWCPECGSTHFWTSLTAWMANQTRNQTAAE